MFLLLLFCNLISLRNAQGQFLISDFRPKIKGSPHTANHIIQDDGKIVMLGDYAFAGDTPVPNLLRFNADGSLDKDFALSKELRDQFTTDFGICCTRSTVVKGPGGDLLLMQGKWQGRVTIIDGTGKFKRDIQSPSGYMSVGQFVRHKDGYVAIGNMFSSRSVMKFDRNGNVDPAFAKIDFVGNVEDIVVDQNNSIFMVGNFTVAGNTRKILKIKETGVIDNTFSDVSFVPNFTELNFFPDGKMVLSSYTDIMLLDATGNKIATFSPDTDSKPIYSTAVDPINNRIIILIDQYPQPAALMALNLDGSISDQFVPVSIGSANLLSRILPKGDKFVLATGDEMQYGASSHSFLQFSSIGIVDTEVSTKEKLFNVGYVNDAVELADGSLIVGGSFTHIGNTEVKNLAKLDRSGNVDITFAGNNPLSQGDVVEKLEVAADNKVYVGGSFYHILGDRSSLIRINTSGKFDPSFVTHALSYASGEFLRDFVVMRDRIIACGSYGENLVAFDFTGNTIPAFKTNIFQGQSVMVKSLCKVDDDNFAIGGEVLNGKGFLWVMDLNGNIDNNFARQDNISISSEHLAKVGNEIYRAGQILGGQSSLDANAVFKYNILNGQAEATSLGTYTFSKNLHVLPLNDTMVVLSGKFDRFNNANASNIAISDYKGSLYNRLTFQVSPGVLDHQVSRVITLSGERILLLGHFESINGEPYYSAAAVHYTNFKPLVDIKNSYSVPEDTSFYLADLIDITDMDDKLEYRLENNDKLQLTANGLVTLKKDFAGTIDLKFTVNDALTTSGPFTTTLTVEPVNDAPVIKRQREVPGIVAGQNYEITPAILEVEDVDGDEVTLTVHAGAHYSLSGGTSIVPEAMFNGELKVGISASDGVLTSEVFIMTIGSGDPTGIEEISALAFYPNPFSDYLKVSSWENVERLSIRSVTGQEVASYDQSQLGQVSGMIDANTLPKGVLLVGVVLKTKEHLYVKVIRR
ncbi:Ig-like domain-containing protein [Chryseolinea sp. T2]|uniref:Ig-like domain-containing protein n=1 Tax=Chryseolinea sp. T2 TaxID=3129255 RepID=UPI003076C9DA